MASIELSNAVLQALNVSLVALYEEGMTEAEAEMSRITEVAYVGPSDSDANIYVFHANQAILAKKPKDSDEFRVNGVKVYSERVENDRRYYAIEVHRDHLADDKVGQYATIFSDMGRAVALAPSQLLESVILAGTDAVLGLCYDGVPFFSHSHPVHPFQSGSATYDNWLIQPTGLTFATFEIAYGKMRGLLGEDGKSMGSKPNLLVVSPEYEGIGIDICYNRLARGYAGAENPWAGKLDLLVVPNWAGLNVWMLADNRQNRRRPFVYQEREAFALVSAIDPTLPDVFKHDKYLYKADGRDGAGYGYPQKAIWNTLS